MKREADQPKWKIYERKDDLGVSQATELERKTVDRPGNVQTTIILRDGVERITT